MSDIAGIHDPEIEYEVVLDEKSLRLVMHFQDAREPGCVAKVSLEMGGIEAIKMAAELVGAARTLGVDTIAFTEALARSHREARP